MERSLFAELLRHPGVDEAVSLRGAIGVLAPHGGNLEGGTDRVATAAADAAGASLYTVCQPEGLRWHIPSTLIGPDDSPALASFLGHVDTAIAVHGYGRPSLRRCMLVGGRNRELAALVASALRENVLGFRVIDDLDEIPRELRGLHPRNVVNLPPLGGVQLELPPSARDPEAPGLVAALADAIAAYGASRSIDQPLGDDALRR
jgi:phage replication-related protein YjqB (UPF0714/DUF867 family)